MWKQIEYLKKKKKEKEKEKKGTNVGHRWKKDRKTF